MIWFILIFSMYVTLIKEAFTKPDKPEFEIVGYRKPDVKVKSKKQTIVNAIVEEDTVSTNMESLW